MSTSEEVTAAPWLAPTPGGVGALTSWTAVDGRPRVASSGSDGTIRVWDPELGITVARLPTGDDDSQRNAVVLRLAAWTGPDGSLVAAASETGVLQVWDADAVEPSLTQLIGHDGWIQALAFWTDGHGLPRLASGGGDHTPSTSGRDRRCWDSGSPPSSRRSLCRSRCSTGRSSCWVSQSRRCSWRWH
jgi:WD40 repeat protein